MEARAKVRIGASHGQFYAELRDREGPPRVDVWRGTAWLGQWAWLPEIGMGDSICRNKWEQSPDEAAIRRIGTAFRDKGC